MACDNCPEKQHLSGAVYIVYGGGPPHAQFATVARAIPPAEEGVVTLYGTPTVNSDGSITYPRGTNKNGPKPPVPAGYERVPGDPWTLRPVWVSCAFRLLRVQAIEDGSLNIAGLCMNPKSGQSSHRPHRPQQPLDPEVCKTCPVRTPIPRLRPSTPARRG
jgi:hypothetical protein